MPILNPYTCVRQHDAADCGAACLSTVVRHFGFRISVARIREYARTDQRGTTVLGIVEAARRLGFDSRGVKAGSDALANVDLPCIAHVVSGTNSHYVVIHKVTAKHLMIADPACGVRRIRRSEFIAIWTGVLVLVTPGRDLRATRGDLSATFRARLLHWIRPHWHLLACAGMSAFLFTILGMASSVFLQLLVDRVLVQRDIRMLWGLTLVVMALSVFRAGLGFLRGVLLARVGQRIDSSLMLDYFRHVLHLPLRFFETRNTGEILARFNDIVKVRDVIGGSAVVVLVDAATMIAGFCFLFHYNRTLASLSLLLWTLPLLATCAANGSLRRSQRLAMEQGAGVQSWLVESLGGIATIKSLSAEEAVFRKAQDRVRRLLNSVFRAWVVALSANAVGEACSSVAALSVLAGAGWMVLEGRMSPGEMVAFYSILLLMLQPVQRLIAVNQAIQDAAIAAERLNDTMDLEQEPRTGAPVPCLAGGIELRGVCFRYGMAEPVIRNLSFAVPPCSVIALVGPSGSGKSTIAKLLLRLYPPQSGNIEVDGNDISQLRISELRSQVRYVGPDAFLFSGTLRENLLYGDAGAEDEAMREALCAAGLRWLTLLPGYLDIPVGERGVGFSGGQRQQLSIARALLSRPRVLILDEATSNLDPAGDAAVFRHIQALRQRMTVVVIGHALRPELEADHVVMIRDGAVVQTGIRDLTFIQAGKRPD